MRHTQIREDMIEALSHCLLATDLHSSWCVWQSPVAQCDGWSSTCQSEVLCSLEIIHPHYSLRCFNCWKPWEGWIHKHKCMKGSGRLGLDSLCYSAHSHVWWGSPTGSRKTGAPGLVWDQTELYPPTAWWLPVSVSAQVPLSFKECVFMPEKFHFR